LKVVTIFDAANSHHRFESGAFRLRSAGRLCRRNSNAAQTKTLSATQPPNIPITDIG
jgi:hypothetical protein